MPVSHTIPAAQGSALATVSSRMENLAGILSDALATWATRDDSRAQPEIRQAANTAFAAIDTMLAELHSARAALADEMHDSDRAADARVDALLAVPLAERVAAREAQIRAELDAPRTIYRLGFDAGRRCGDAR